MADVFEIGNHKHNSEEMEFQIEPITVEPPEEFPEVNWLFIVATVLTGAGATYAATA